jgi:ankyrin repeat protein
MLSTRTLFLCVLVSGQIFFTPVNTIAQETLVDTTEFIQEDTENARNYNLQLAASYGYDVIIDRLVAKGADINTTFNSGVTPLVYAVSNKHRTTVETILSHNPDINKMTFRYETPLMVAVKNQDADIAELLIRSGADIDRSDQNGATPLHFAALYGNFVLTDMLLYYEADCDRKSADGTSPLMAAAWAGNADIADLLVQNGANMEARDNDGFTPFLIASQFGDTLLMNYFLTGGVNLYEKNNNNFSALDLAIANDHKEAVALLLERGDQWNSAENSSLNPYRIAYDYNRKDLVRMLENKSIPGKTSKRINETSISISTKFTFRDIYTGARFSLKESVLNGGIFVGSDLKLWYTRILLKGTEDTYYQYFNRNSIIYAGIFKDYTLAESPARVKLSFSGSLAAGYLFGNILKGSYYTPDNKLKIIPSASLKLQKENFMASAGIEYMKSDFLKIGSVWGRISLSYCFFADRITNPGKTIKWH